MLKKLIITVCINIVLIASATAQYGNFSIKIKKVFPSTGVVYENSYNLLDELDKAKLTAIDKYQGTSENYLIELVTPNGKKTEMIQNIRWIMTENGKKTYYKTKPTPKKCYPQSTLVTIYECQNDGFQKGQPASYEYKYTYRLLINKKQQDYDNNYYTQKSGDEQAKNFIIQKSNSDALYEIYNENRIVATNAESYKKSVCDNMFKRYKDVQNSSDSILMNFYYDELAKSDCQDVKDSVCNERNKRYENKMAEADTVPHERKLVLYEEAKVLNPEKKEEINNYIVQENKIHEEQDVVISKKKGLNKGKSDKGKNKKITNDKEKNKKKDKKNNKDKSKKH